MSLDSDIRTKRMRLAGFTLLYGLGRVTSYTLAGLISGFTGKVLGDILHPWLIGNMLRLFSGILTMAIGAHVAGWLPRLAGLERIGDPIWCRIWPLARKFLPVRTPIQAWLAGILWGWLPCSLVYSMLVIAALSGSPLEGAALLFAFGSGTLPGLWLGGVITGWLMRLHVAYWLSPLAGLVLIISGFITLWANISPDFHQSIAIGNHHIF